MILADKFHYTDKFLRQCREQLEFAFENVPLYRKWKVHDPGPGHSLDERYDALPVLDKAAMRSAFPAGLVPVSQDLQAGLDSDRIEYTFTSGTTQEKVVNIFDLDWWARSEKASWKLNSALAALPYPQPTAKLASSLNVGVNCEEDLSMSQRTLGNTLYLNEKTNMIQWRPDHFARMAKELNEFRPVILEANPTLLARLSHWAMDTGTAIRSPAAIVFTFEFPSVISLRAIRKVFSSPFVSSYGSTETGFVLEECEDGLLHQNTEFCRIDFLPLKGKYNLPGVGRIFVTTFDNPWNVIVRFDVGDLVRLRPSSECACGRNSGMTADRIEGRISNLTFTTKGIPVTTAMIDEKLAEIPELRDYHLEQETKKSWRLEVMLERSSTAVLRALRDSLASVYGADGRFRIEVKKTILPGPAGKFRRTQADFQFREKGLFA